MKRYPKTYKVCCSIHGKGNGCFVCDHLRSQSGKGYYCADDQKNPYPDAWCADCDRIYLEEGGWTDKAVETAFFRLVCHRCYPEVKRRNVLRLL